MLADEAEVLRAAVRDRLNILVAGGTGPGKTTLTNALLAEIAGSSDRIVLIEETREPPCAAPNPVAMPTQEIGRAQVSTPATNAHLACHLLLDKNNLHLNT